MSVLKLVAGITQNMSNSLFTAISYLLWNERKTSYLRFSMVNFLLMIFILFSFRWLCCLSQENFRILLQVTSSSIQPRTYRHLTTNWKFFMTIFILNCQHNSVNYFTMCNVVKITFLGVQINVFIFNYCLHHTSVEYPICVITPLQG